MFMLWSASIPEVLIFGFHGWTYGLVSGFFDVYLEVVSAVQSLCARRVHQFLADYAERMFQ